MTYFNPLWHKTKTMSYRVEQMTNKKSYCSTKCSLYTCFCDTFFILLLYIYIFFNREVAEVG